MRPVQCDIGNLARKWLNIRAISICPDIVNIIAARFADIMRATHIDEVLNAQIILMKSNTINICLKNVDLYTEFKFHAVLKLANVHAEYCNIIGVVIDLTMIMNSFHIKINSCFCHNEKLSSLCFNAGNIISYDEAKEILRIAYDNSLDLRIKEFGNTGSLIFGARKYVKNINIFFINY